MRSVEIIVTETNGTFIGKLDLTKPSDFGLKLTKSIASIKDVSKRNTSYSLDFNIPNTHNNNEILKGARFVSSSSTQKEILQQKYCQIYIDGNQIERGFIRFRKSKFEDNYTATFYGGNADWVNKLSEVYLNDLDWQNLGEPAAGQEQFTVARVTEIVNTGTADNYDIDYPTIDRNNLNGTDEKRPSFYLRNVIIRMFEKIGYTVTSSFLESSFVKGTGLRSKGIQIDPNVNFTVGQDVIELTRAEYGQNRIPTNTLAGVWDLNYVIGEDGTTNIRHFSKFNNLWNVQIADDSLLFDSATSTYTCNAFGEYNFSFNSSEANSMFAYYDIVGFNDWVNFLFSNWTFAVVPVKPPTIRCYIVKNNVSTTVIDGQILASGSVLFNSDYTNASFSTDVTLNIGDEITFWYEIVDDADGFGNAAFDYRYLDYGQNFLLQNSLQSWRFQPGSQGSSIKIQRRASVSIGDTYSINAHIQTRINCLDLLSDFKTLFNLYFEPDFKRQTILIEPRDAYYLNIGTANNITNKIDVSNPIDIDYSSSYKRNLTFRYKNDSKDEYLDGWEAKNLRNYAEYTHELPERFDKGTTLFETKLIAPTIQGTMPDTKGDIITSVIKKHFDPTKNANEPQNEEYDIRIFQAIREEQIDDAGNSRRTADPKVINVGLMEQYGNVIPLNDKRLTFNGTNGLFADYWAKTIENLQESAVVSLYQRLTLEEFRNIDFRKPVYISEPAQIRGYYVYESIENFDAINEGVTKVNLLKWRSFEGVAVDPSQKTNINTNTTAGQTPQTGALWFVYDEGTPNERYEQVYEIDTNGNFVPIFNT